MSNGKIIVDQLTAVSQQQAFQEKVVKIQLDSQQKQIELIPSKTEATRKMALEYALNHIASGKWRREVTDLQNEATVGDLIREAKEIEQYLLGNRG